MNVRDCHSEVTYRGCCFSLSCHQASFSSFSQSQYHLFLSSISISPLFLLVPVSSFSASLISVLMLVSSFSAGLISISMPVSFLSQRQRNLYLNPNLIILSQSQQYSALMSKANMPLLITLRERQTYALC